MTGLLQRALRNFTSTLDYETAKQLAASADRAKRLKAARLAAKQPEILYYLARDPLPDVRAAVAENEATPVQADVLLAADADESVRSDLAAKIARLAPGLGADAHDRLRQLTYEVLQTLVRDNVPRVRAIIAEALKDVADAPPDIIQRLARDCEIAVAGPVLQFSPVLTDDDILSIIADAPIAGALTAIARRQGLGEGIADAVGGSGDIEAITALLENKTAQIREAMLDFLVENGADKAVWHAPLVARPHLSANAIGRLAGFIATNLLAALRQRADLDEHTAKKVGEIVMRRLAESTADDASEVVPLATAFERARALLAAGDLNNDAIGDAALTGDRALVRAGLSLLSGFTAEAVDKLLQSRSARAVVALCWKAGLSMETAARLQQQVCRLPLASIIRPRGDGVWPLPQETMRWQLDLIVGSD